MMKLQRTCRFPRLLIRHTASTQDRRFAEIGHGVPARRRAFFYRRLQTRVYHEHNMHISARARWLCLSEHGREIVMRHD